MELSNMNLAEVDERLASLEVEVREMTDVADVEKATEEKKALLERKAQLIEAEERKATAKAIEDGKAEVKKVEERKEDIKMSEERKITVESPEYRDAFYAMLAGNATAEQRATLATPISVDGTGSQDGMAIAIPKTLDDKIWDNIHTAHPITADVTTIRSGVVMEVTRHTAIVNRATSKKDGDAAPADQTNTFVKVSLAGKDFATFTELTYAAAKMSQGALEDYLAEEIAAELGEDLAKYIFTTILADAGNAQKVTPAEGSDLFTNIKLALALATMGGKKTIYAPSTSYYEIVGAIKQGSPFNIAATLGVECKLDDAATKVTVVDAKAFVLNEVQATMVESDKDIKAHKIVVSGYNRSEGTLRYTKAAAYIA